jgi:hypothetical protein
MQQSNNRHKLKYLGDWVVNYILNQNPNLLLNINKPVEEGGSSGNWHNAVKTLIKEFYKAVNREEALTWIDLYVALNQISQSKEDAISILRTFLIDTINNLYTRHLKTFEGSDTTTEYKDSSSYNATRHQVMVNRNLGDRLEWLLDHDLVPYIKGIKITNSEKTVLIYRQILEELKSYNGHNTNLPTMQDIENFLGFKYTQIRIGNSRPHIITGSLQVFKEFLCMEIEELETQQTLNATDTT